MADRTIVTRMRVEYKQAVDGMNAVGSAAGKAANEIEGSGKKADTAFSKMAKNAAENEQAWTAAGGVLTGVGAGIVAMGVAATKTGIEFNSLKQTSGSALKTVLGSAEAASRQMDKLNAFGDKSWVMRDVLIRAQQQMTGFGVETQKVIPYLDGLQEAVAAAGGSSQTFEELAGVMAKVKSQGKITAETFNEFGTRGVDAATIIGEQMGQTGQEIRDSVTNGSLDADKALDALAKGMKTKFDGATENLRTTFRGAMDNLAAAWRNLSSEMASPLVDPDGGGVAVSGLNAIADAMANVTNVAKGIPAPVKATVLAVGGIAGAASLAAGGFLLLAPRVVETQNAFKTLAGQDDLVGKTARGLGAMKAPLANIAKAGATVAVLGAIAVQIGKVAESKGLQEAEDATRGLGRALEELKGSSTALDGLFQDSSGNAITGEIDSLDSALDRTFNKNWEQKFSDWGESILQPLTGLRGASGLLEDQFSALDAELAGMVEGDNAKGAAAAFEEIKNKAAELEIPTEDLVALFPEYAGAVEDAGLASSGAAGGVGELSAEAVAAKEHLEEVRKGLVDGANGFLDFTEKAKESKTTLQEWINDMEDQVEAQASWMDNLSILAERGAPQALLDQLMALGPQGAQKVKELADGSDADMQRVIDVFAESSQNVTDFANKVAGIPPVDLDADASKLKGQVKTAKERLDELRKLPTTPEIDAQITLLEEKVKAGRQKLKDLENQKTEPKIDADTKPAKSDVEAFDDWLDKRKNPLINIDAKVKIINEGQIRNMPETLLNPNRPKNYAPGVQKASGGSITGPGTGTSDSIPAMLSNGEHVWTAEEVRKAGGHGAIEAMRAAVKSGNAFAGGGAVGSAERRLADAQRQLDSISRRGQKRTPEDVRRDAAQKRVDRARAAVDRAKEAAARRERVSALQDDFKTDLRRGSLRDQVTGSLSGGFSAVDRLAGFGSDENLSRGSRSKANSSARKFEANLSSLYSQAERIDDRLKKAQDKAQELKGIKDSVVNSLLGGRDLDVGTFQTQTNGQWESHSNLGQAAKGMRADVGGMKAFAGKLKKLTELGIPGAIIQEIAQAGVSEGTNMADSFIDATAAERKSYMGAWSDYEKYANQAGQYVSEGFQAGGASAADGVVKGLEGKKKSVESAIANLAKAMESTFKSVLGIHSPSRVMSELGGFTAEGLAQGMLGGAAGVQSAADVLAQSAVPNMMGFAPSDVAFDVSANPVVEDDEGMAGLAMQDMSTTTLEAMQLMRVAVSEGWASMLLNTQESQAGMLLDTQTKQTGMLSSTQSANAAKLLNTQTQQAAMLLNTQTQNAAMLSNTQVQQEAMRFTVSSKQQASRYAATEQQEAMRVVLAEKQASMKSRASDDFESMRSTTSSKFSSMRSNTDGTMSGMHGDYSGRLGDLRGLNKRGFESIVDTSNANMRGVRDGIDNQMAAARPELGGRMNDLIRVLGSFTDSVNKAFGDVGVKLKSPKSLKFATGGVLPGYTPGRDVHDFYSSTGGHLGLSGGEAIMRPEFTKAVGGKAGVDRLNREAMNGRVDSHSDHFANGGVMPSFNFASGGTLMDAAMWWVGKGARGSRHPAFGGPVRSGHSRGSMHYQDKAVDFNYGPGGTNAIEQAFFDKYVGQFKGQFPGIRTIWRAPGHFNHLHIDTSNGADMGNFAGAGNGGGMSHPFLDRAKVSPGSDMSKAYAKAAKKLTSQIYAKHAKELPDGIGGQLGRGIMADASEGLIDKAKDYGKTTAVSGTSAGDPAVKAAVRKLAEQYGWADQWGDIDWLVNKESGWNPKAANPSSSARGLFQKMTSIHGPIEDTVEGQARWGFDYIKNRYNDPRGARSFWERNNWYESGTASAKSGWAVVGEDGPELVNLSGGEQIKNGQETRKLLAENRTFIPNQRSGFDTSALSDAMSAAIQSNGINANDLAAALNGVKLTFQADGQQFTGAVTAVVGSGYDESRSRLAKSSQKIGAR